MINKKFLELLKCPKTGGKLELLNPKYINDKIISGELISKNKVHTYKIENFIPRFVGDTNYADNFGIQWNKFSKTQLDKYSMTNTSARRFWLSTKWNKNLLKNKLILDVGCGAGRFAEIALSCGAIVVGLDYSNSVDACYKNLQNKENLYLIQADIYDLPFHDETFDFVYSLGVLQHTPNVKQSVGSIFKKLKKDGYFCVDFYEHNIASYFHPKYILRPFTKRLPNKILFKIVNLLVILFLPMCFIVSYIPIFGRFIKKIIPIASYFNELSLSLKQHYEWSLLDTIDWYAPTYDNPQSRSNLKSFIDFLNLKDPIIEKPGHLVLRGRR